MDRGTSHADGGIGSRARSGATLVAVAVVAVAGGGVNAPAIVASMAPVLASPLSAGLFGRLAAFHRGRAGVSAPWGGGAAAIS